MTENFATIAYALLAIGYSAELCHHCKGISSWRDFRAFLTRRPVRRLISALALILGYAFVCADKLFLH